MQTIKEATAVAGSLGFPSKMPGTAYGISAHNCQTGGKLHDVPGSVCEDCYALKGNYLYPDIAKGHAKREAGIENPAWVGGMIMLLTATHKRGTGRNGPISSGWHRWHDSGDIQSVAHLAKICDVARRTPQIKHWLPTREMGYVKAFIAGGGTVPDNLTIRVSATMVDGPATKAWPQTSRVHQNAAPVGHVCPAPKQDGHCGDCRACWSRDVAQVSYHKH